MAHGLECKVCGYQEAAHECDPDQFPGVCNAYVSPDPEWEQAEWDRADGCVRQLPSEDLTL